MTVNATPNYKVGYKATADIAAYKAVKHGTYPNIVIAGAGDKAFAFTTEATLAGNPVTLAGQGSEAQGIAGGTIAVGDFLKADSSGNLVATTTANDFCCARALEPAVSGDVFRVDVIQQLY